MNKNLKILTLLIALFLPFLSISQITTATPIGEKTADADPALSKQEKETVLTDESKEGHLYALSDLTRNFMGLLKSEQFDSAKEYLAPKLAAQLTNDQLKQLSSIIHDIEVDMIYNGIEKGMNDAVFQMLHFKYSTDESQSPKEIIKVLFDKNDKIASFQPLKMK